MPSNPEKPKSEYSGLIKCPKCGHEFQYDPGWKKASNVIGCPKCAAVIRVRKPEVD
jgi:ribosomal protein S27E